jgi:hypothetical protein
MDAGPIDIAAEKFSDGRLSRAILRPAGFFLTADCRSGAVRRDYTQPPKPLGGRTMRYLCLVYIDERKFDRMPRSEWDALANEALDHDEQLRRSGHYLVSEALESIDAATTIRVRDGKLSVTDGPFAETKEHLGGFILIEAKDLDDAIQAMSTIPMARLGSIEIRPVLELKREGGARLGRAPA